MSDVTEQDLKAAGTADGTDGATDGAAVPERGRKLWLVALLPIIGFCVIGWFLYQGLSLDPSKIPSVLIEKPAPEFDLPPRRGKPLGLAKSDLTQPVQLVNVFASWCVACRVEHPLLMELKRNGTVPIYGLNYKDQPRDALNWLGNFGDPYDRIGTDVNGRVGIDFGVYGVPETFVIDRNGVIVHKVIGPITPQILETRLKPLIAELSK